ncbi:SGNH/GDSL hydrolase family protein [Streptomyces sp. NPDC087440]|uniref:SGNH/GDSL hydrolase family protein n=1 Tax=Streptomyces sp. NPDC087440 TaxID=3365790 RepID=UPI0037FB2510
MRKPRPYAIVLVLLLLWCATGCAFFAEPPEEEPPPPAPRAPAAPTAQRPAPTGHSPTQAPEPQTVPDPPRPPGERPTVLYLGDSLAMENQLSLAETVAADGRATVHSAPYSGTTLCDYLTGRPTRSLVPVRDKAAALVATHRPRVVVLQFWGNAWGFTPCMDNIPQSSARYYTRYAEDAATLTSQIASAARRAGIPRPRIIWVLQGPDAFAHDRIPRVNDLYRAQAAASGDALADAGRAVSAPGARYTWRRQLPCTDAESATPDACRNGLTSLHRTDDPLHFCLAPTTTTPRPCPAPSPGITRYTKAIADVVDRHVR